MVAQEQELSSPAREAWYCWKARPLADFPFLERWAIRFMYRLFGWSFNDGSREGLCIAWTEEEAKEIIGHYKGGNAQPYPFARTVGDALPDQIVQYGKRIPTDPEAQKFYLRRRFKQVGVNADLLDETKELAAELKRRRV
jgi:hypothetical protein